MQFWNELEGQVIEGYPLRRLVRSEGRTAWFDIGGTDSQPATISLTESLTDTDEVVERLEAAQQLKNPNLIAISRVGRTRIGETLVVYAIMEHSDQDLSEVLRNQALSKEEAREVAEAMVDGLLAIHQRGLVHGRVEPASVLAVGETVKLRSDCLQSPGGTRAGDVAGIGATLFQAFTQRKASSADDALINRIPAPFAEIVRNSLSARWGLAQIASVLKPALANQPAVSRPVTPVAPASVPGPAAAAPAKVVPPGISPTQRPAASPAQPVAPEATVAPARTAFVKEDAEDADLDSPRRQPVGLYATVAIAVLLLLAWLFFRPKTKPPTVAGPVVTGRSAVPETPAEPPPTAPETKPSPVVPAQPAAERQSAVPGRAVRPVWRVVAYTYEHQDQAQSKVDEINHAHPELAASVFSARSNRGPYLVTLGGPMDRSQAFKLRAQAISSGLPNDSYAQNFSH